MSIKNFLHKQVYLTIIHYYDLFQDLKRGINTRENCEITELGFTVDIGNKYQPLGYKRLIEVNKFTFKYKKEVFDIVIVVSILLLNYKFHIL